MRIFKLPVILVVILLFLSSCGTNPKQQTSTHFNSFKNEYIDERVLDGNEQLSFHLFHEINREKQDENIFISPFSVSTALMMTTNGAAEQTLEQMKDTLGFNGIENDVINRSFAGLQYDLQNLGSNQTLNIANSIWTRDGFEPYDEFKSTNEKFFDASTTALDFNSPDASKTINKWVHDKTNGKIDKIIPTKIDADTVMFLINAVYFKGTWKYPFDLKSTRDGTFHLKNGDQVTVPFMTLREAHLEFLFEENLSAVRLPYGENGSMVMTVFVPNDGFSLDELLESFTQENWKIWNQYFQATDGNVRLPKFQLENEHTLNDILISLGMEDAFSGVQANFSNLAQIPPNLYIGDVKHKTFIDVNEEGTEAAAVTKVEIKAESARQVPELNANRPFLFTIHDKQSGTILFIGKMENPTN